MPINKWQFGSRPLNLPSISANIPVPDTQESIHSVIYPGITEVDWRRRGMGNILEVLDVELDSPVQEAIFMYCEQIVQKLETQDVSLSEIKIAHNNFTPFMDDPEVVSVVIKILKQLKSTLVKNEPAGEKIIELMRGVRSLFICKIPDYFPHIWWGEGYEMDWLSPVKTKDGNELFDGLSQDTFTYFAEEKNKFSPDMQMSYMDLLHLKAWYMVARDLYKKHRQNLGVMPSEQKWIFDWPVTIVDNPEIAHSVLLRRNKLLSTLTLKNKDVPWLLKLSAFSAIDLNSEVSKQDLKLACHLYKWISLWRELYRTWSNAKCGSVMIPDGNLTNIKWLYNQIKKI